jgi:hypothetical protein
MDAPCPQGTVVPGPATGPMTCVQVLVKVVVVCRLSVAIPGQTSQSVMVIVVDVESCTLPLVEEVVPVLEVV